MTHDRRLPDDAAQWLVAALLQLADRVHVSGSHEDTYRLIATTAVEGIVGCDAASISTLEKSGPVSHGPTGPLAERADQIQYEQAEGPFWDAAMSERWIYIPDIHAAGRWPTSSRRLADELGVRSMFSCRLAVGAKPRATLGGINLYSLAPDGFTAADQLLAILLSLLGAAVVMDARRQENLQAAIATRQVIGEAIGILRAQSSLTSEQAFDMLVSASMRTNVKLRDVARQIARHPPH